MGGQQGANGADATTDDLDPRVAARAERRARRQRRQEERRRRWSRTPAAASGAVVPEEDGVEEAPARAAAAAAPAAGTTGTTAGKSAGKSAEKAAEKAAGKTDPKVAGGTDEKAADEATERSVGKPSAKPAAAKPAAANVDGPTEEPAGSTAVLTRDPAERDAAAPATTGPVVVARGPAALWQLVLTAHPRQAVVVAAGFAGAAALAGRSPEEIGLLGAMALVGQAMLGWHNDLVDRDRDAAALAVARDRGDPGRRRPKPIAEGRLEPGTVWYAFAIALLLLFPLSVASGVVAAAAYVVSVAIGMLGNIMLRGGWLSPLPWAASWALYPAVLSYAGPTGGPAGGPPQPALVALAAALGVAVHVLRALPGLVDDNREGLRHLPLRIALRTGAPRLLGLAGVVAVGLVIALVTVGAQLGLVR